MIALSTKQKIACAKVLHRGVRSVRRLFGHGMQARCTRRGLSWNLDLDEGIDFKIWIRGSFEPELERFYESALSPGAIVLDLGANIGAHTLPLARAVGPNGQVFAVEATRYAIEKLRANLTLNPTLSARVTTLHALLVDSTDAAPIDAIASSWPLIGQENVHPTLRGALRQVGEAEILTLDQIVQTAGLSRIDLIKLDVDGHELKVLSGGSDILARFRPPILMELAPYCHADQPGQFEALYALLVNAGYQFRDLNTRKTLPKTLAGLLKVIPTNGSINVLAESALTTA
jgi:FkbM family methyltransferase